MNIELNELLFGENANGEKEILMCFELTEKFAFMCPIHSNEEDENKINLDMNNVKVFDRKSNNDSPISVAFFEKEKNAKSVNELLKI